MENQIENETEKLNGSCCYAVEILKVVRVMVPLRSFSEIGPNINSKLPFLQQASVSYPKP